MVSALFQEVVARSVLNIAPPYYFVLNIAHAKFFLSFCNESFPLSLTRPCGGGLGARLSPRCLSGTKGFNLLNHIKFLGINKTPYWSLEELLFCSSSGIAAASGMGKNTK